ncbi:MAG: hypothetical protein JXA13_10625 [Anaerolineales bacterium]|nr:hypothetical protein [Anaerolineales bacterium]
MANHGELPKVLTYPGAGARHARAQSNDRISLRGLFSLTTLVMSLAVLTVSLAAGAWLVQDLLHEGLGTNLTNDLGILLARGLVIGLAFGVGWVISLGCIRVFNNLILPIFIRIYAWTSLIGVAWLYLRIIGRLFLQAYDFPHYWAYLIVMASGLGVVIGFHLLLEDHDLRPMSIPLLMINVIQLIAIVFRYVFTDTFRPAYLKGDLLFFFTMTTISLFMLAHLGILAPIRTQLNCFFDRDWNIIRPEG